MSKASKHSPTGPLVQRLDDFDWVAAFRKLAHLPHCLWLDSAARGPELEPGGDHAGRYSFLCADPVATLVAPLDAEAYRRAGMSNDQSGPANPWLTLRRWCSALPQQRHPDLPPFQGGIAGLWGYEAGTWLEPVGHAQINDLPTPAISVGLYDWVLCHDRLRSQTWIVSWGFRDASCVPDTTVAQSRIDELLERLRCRDVSSESNKDVRRKVSESDLAGLYQTHWPSVWSNFSSDGFRLAIETIIESIRAGDSFQVNLAQRLLTPATGDSASLYLRLREANAAPYAGYYNGGDFQVISSSPEGFLRLRNRVVQTRPIKGTVARTGDEAVDRALAAELSQSEKDRAENVMIVDLMRNDLSRVCEDDSVRVSQLCSIETYAHVQHLVSVVEGRLRDEISAIDLLAACFPGGSVTGAPKIEAMRTIAKLEPTTRGPYCGSFGYVSCSGDAEFNILIRTITAAHGWWQIPVGGGITLRSHAAAEEQETWVKAEGMLRAIGSD